MTRKIELKLDTLTVESFETGMAASKDGTVHAHAAISVPDPCIPRTQIQTCDRGLTCTDVFHACIC